MKQTPELLAETPKDTYYGSGIWPSVSIPFTVILLQVTYDGSTRSRARTCEPL